MFSRLLAFLLLPFLSGQIKEPFRFVALGDSGSGSSAQLEVAEQMWRYRERHPYQLVLMLGDNIYGSTELTAGGHSRFFDQKFDRAYERFLEAGVVIHAVIGNHDTQTDEGRHEIADKHRFGILGEDGYYRFASSDTKDRKPRAEFFALNSELEGEKMTRQIEWFRREVAQSGAVWKFVFLHHPLYTIRGQRAPAVALRRQIDEAMKANRVQFVI